MPYTLFPAETFQSQAWSGGLSTQLYIYPTDAAYQQRDFIFRLSSATVEVETSIFSVLPNVSRKLMILEGSTTLTHAQHHVKQLQKFEVDTFEGDWQTTSVGTCIDFNVMTKGQTKSTLSGQAIGAAQSLNYSLNTHCDYIFIYTFSGTVCTKIGNHNLTMRPGDLLALQTLEQAQLLLSAIENSELVFVEIEL